MNLINQPAGASCRLSFGDCPSLLLCSQWLPATRMCPDLSLSKAGDCIQPVDAGRVEAGPSGSIWEGVSLGPFQGADVRWARLPAVSPLGVGVEAWWGVVVLLHPLRAVPLFAIVLQGSGMPTSLAVKAKGSRGPVVRWQLQKLRCGCV